MASEPIGGAERAGGMVIPRQELESLARYLRLSRPGLPGATENGEYLRGYLAGVLEDAGVISKAEATEVLEVVKDA